MENRLNPLYSKGGQCTRRACQNTACQAPPGPTESEPAFQHHQRCICIVKFEKHVSKYPPIGS